MLTTLIVAIILQCVCMSALNMCTFIFHPNKAKKKLGDLEFVMFWYVIVH